MKRYKQNSLTTQIPETLGEIKMQYSINRYSLKKELISTGTLTVIDEGDATKLIYVDIEIEETAYEKYHPLTALESLRNALESNHKSILNCNGCRIDTDFRPTGSYGIYLIKPGKPATESLCMFEPTDEITKLCTVEEHKLAYEKWLDSLQW